MTFSNSACPNMEVDMVADIVDDKEVHKMMNEVTKDVKDIAREKN